MKSFRSAFLLVACAAPCLGQGEVIHDKTGACELTLPADWTVDKSTTWIGSAPKSAGNVQLVSQPGKTVRPLTTGDQKALLVGKMISNTKESVFYMNEAPKNANPLKSYRAVAPGKGGTCVALFSIRSAITEETLKTMVASLK
jgi:hypothetical protein